jgi:hypothetical protein
MAPNEIGSVRSEIAQVQSELRSEIALVRGEIVQVKADLMEHLMRRSLDGLRADLQHFAYIMTLMAIVASGLAITITQL